MFRQLYKTIIMSVLEAAHNLMQVRKLLRCMVSVLMHLSGQLHPQCNLTGLKFSFKQYIKHQTCSDWLCSLLFQAVFPLGRVDLIVPPLSGSSDSFTDLICFPETGRDSMASCQFQFDKVCGPLISADLQSVLSGILPCQTVMISTEETQYHSITQ